MKVKIFPATTDEEKLEIEINIFLKTRKVIEIQYKIMADADNNWYSALIIYKEEKQKAKSKPEEAAESKEQEEEYKKRLSILD